MTTAANSTHDCSNFERYAPGFEVQNAQAGDFLLTHSRSWTGWLIRFGQRFRYYGPDKKYARWCHVALFVNNKGDIVEAIGGGVQLRNVSVYRDTEYHVVYLSNVSPQDRAQEVAFARHCLNSHYGFMTILSLALD